MGDMGHGAMNHSSPTGQMGMRKRHFMHMTFFWGKNSEILFSGWPGANGGMYAVAVIFVFVLALAVEWFNHCNIIKPEVNHVAAGLAKTAMHAVRVGLANLVMLAMMSFNGGVFIAAVLGHAVGFLLFGSSVFRRELPSPPAKERKGDLPPCSC